MICASKGVPASGLRNFVYFYLANYYIDVGNIVMHPDGSKEFYFKDHIGSVRVVLTKEATGTTYMDTYDYKPFGEIIYSTTGKSDLHGYAGDEFDFESDLVDMGARMYMPEIGRFLSVDPLAEAFPTQSPYNFAYNNPINFRDPSGLAQEITHTISYHNLEHFMKTLNKVLITLLFMMLPYQLCYSTDKVEDDLRRFATGLVRNSDNYIAYLDTNRLVDGSAFAKILVMDSLCFENFEKYLKNLEENFNGLKFKSRKFCNTNKDIYSIHLEKDHDQDGFYLLTDLYFLMNTDSSQKKYRVEYSGDGSFLKNFYKNDIESIRTEFTKLIKADFDLTPGITLFNTEAVRLLINESAFVSEYYELLKKHFSSRKDWDKTVFYRPELVVFTKTEAKYPTFEILVRIEWRGIRIEVQRRNCLCENANPEYVITSVHL